jgi:hypothetical protein
MNARPRHLLRPLSLAALVLFNLSLLWCLDEGCGSQGRTDDCTSIACALSHGEDDEAGSPTGATSKSCSCPTQAPSLVCATMVPGTLMLCEGELPALAMRVLSAPNPSVFHPPLG